MKYSLEADKYRAAYMPPSTLAMSMYSDPKYLDTSPKSYLDRTYFDSAKAYFEQSKLYMDQKPIITDYSRSYDSNKMYDESSPGGAGSISRSPVTDSPETNKQMQDVRVEQGSGGSSTSPSSTASPGIGGLSAYYPSSVQGGGLLAPQMGQYPGYQSSSTAANEFRRPLVIF